jgi:hypothetical protein
MHSGAYCSLEPACVTVCATAVAAASVNNRCARASQCGRNSSDIYINRKSHGAYRTSSERDALLRSVKVILDTTSQQRFV